MSNGNERRQVDCASENPDGGLDGSAGIEARFLKILGRALRSEREIREWTRQDLALAMGVGQATQTIATHEFGTRAMTVARFALYCNVLGLTPGRLFGRVYDEAIHDGVVVNLAGLARSEHPLARWAEIRLRELPPSSIGRLLVPRSAHDTLAELCECDRHQLLAELKAA